MHSDSLPVILFAVALGCIPAIIAKSKGYRFFPFLLMGAIFFIGALPLAIFLKPNRNMKMCPECERDTHADYRHCMHCEFDFLDVVGAREKAKAESEQVRELIAAE